MKQEERLTVVFETATSMVTRTPDAWVKYLQFASRIYKYAFDNSLLIYAQDPSATMLATEEVWKRVGRIPKTQARLIAVCEYHNAKNSLKYLLDVSQTNGNAFPEQWKLDNEGRTQLAINLSGRYDQNDPILNNVISDYVNNALEQSFEQYMQDFELDITGHFFSNLPKDGLYQQMREIISTSVRIFISFRCGNNIPQQDIDALATISHFDTVPLVARLGTIVTDVSKHILLDIERTVKATLMERSKSHEQPEQPDIHREKWPSVPEHQHGEHINAPGQIWKRMGGVHSPESSAALHHSSDDGQTGGNRTKGGSGGIGKTGGHLPAVGDAKSSPGYSGHYGKDPVSEQLTPPSGGDRAEPNRVDATISKPTPSKEPQGSFSFDVDLETYFTPNLRIPYHVGDLVLGATLSATIVNVDSRTIQYRLDDDSELHPLEREKFEYNLENGIYRFIESGGQQFAVGLGEFGSELFLPIVNSDETPAQVGGLASLNDEESEELYACVDLFLCSADALYKGWCEELAGVLERNSDYNNIYDDFRDIEEQELVINNRFVECLAFKDKVVFRIDEHELEFSYPGIIERIRSLMEIGDFASAEPVPQEVAPNQPAGAKPEAGSVTPTNATKWHPFQRAKSQPNFDVEAPSTNSKLPHLVEITSIPHSDEINTFAPQHNAIDFQSFAASKVDSDAQLSLSDWMTQAKRIYGHYVLGLSKAAIARAEGIGESAVRNSIQRGLARLKCILKDYK